MHDLLLLDISCPCQTHFAELTEPHPVLISSCQELRVGLEGFKAKHGLLVGLGFVVVSVVDGTLYQFDISLI